MVEKKWLVGVTVLGLCVVTIGLFPFLYGTLQLLKPRTHPAFAIYSVVGIAIGTCGIFILKRKNWARILLLCLTGAYMFYWILIIYAVNYLGVIPGKHNPIDVIKSAFFFGFLPTCVIFYYLTRSKVKEQFKWRNSECR